MALPLVNTSGTFCGWNTMNQRSTPTVYCSSAGKKSILSWFQPNWRQIFGFYGLPWVRFQYVKLDFFSFVLVLVFVDFGSYVLPCAKLELAPCSFGCCVLSLLGVHTLFFVVVLILPSPLLPWDGVAGLEGGIHFWGSCGCVLKIQVMDWTLGHWCGPLTGWNGNGVLGQWLLLLRTGFLLVL